MQWLSAEQQWTRCKKLLHNNRAGVQLCLRVRATSMVYNIIRRRYTIYIISFYYTTVVARTENSIALFGNHAILLFICPSTVLLFFFFFKLLFNNIIIFVVQFAVLENYGATTATGQYKIYPAAFLSFSSIATHAFPLRFNVRANRVFSYTVVALLVLVVFPLYVCVMCM